MTSNPQKKTLLLLTDDVYSVPSTFHAEYQVHARRVPIQIDEYVVKAIAAHARTYTQKVVVTGINGREAWAEYLAKKYPDRFWGVTKSNPLYPPK